MKTLAIISQKGGCGKSTLAVHLAVCAVKAGKTVALMDLDKQESSYQWFETRAKENELIAIQAQAPQLPELLTQGRAGGIDLVIIDTAPHTEAPITQVAKLADFVLVPTVPYVFELRAVPSTVDSLELVKANYSIVINGAPRGRQAEEARAVLEAQGYPVLKPVIHSRVAFRHALADGRSVYEYEPEGRAASEISALFNVLKSKLKL